MLYYLTDAVGLSDDDASSEGYQLTALYGVITVVTAFAGGWWSDRVGKRKVFVIWSGLIAAVALLVYAFFHTWVAAIVGSVILGVGFGAYTGFDVPMIAPSDGPG